MKLKIKAIISVVLILALAFSIVGCGKPYKVSLRVKSIVRSVIRETEKYLDKEISYDVYDILYKADENLLKKEWESHQNDEDLAEFNAALDAWADVGLLRATILTGTKSEVQKKIAELEDKYLG